MKFFFPEKFVAFSGVTVEKTSCTDTTADGRSWEVCTTAKQRYATELAEIEAGKTCEREANCKGPCKQDTELGKPVWMGKEMRCTEEAQGIANSVATTLAGCDAAADAADYGHFYFTPNEGVEDENGPGVCILLTVSETCTMAAGEYTVWQTSSHTLPLTPGKDDVWFCTLRSGNELDQAFEREGDDALYPGLNGKEASSCADAVANANVPGTFVSYEICAAFGAQQTGTEAELRAQAARAAAAAAAEKAGYTCVEEENCAAGADGCQPAGTTGAEQFDFSCALKKDADGNVEGNSCSDTDSDGASEICSAAKSIAKAEFAEKQAGKTCIEEANCKEVNGKKCQKGIYSGGDNPGVYYCELKEFTEGELAGESAATNSACTDVTGNGADQGPYRSYELCGAYAAEQATLEAEISAAKVCEPLTNCNSHHCMQDGFLGDGVRISSRTRV